MTSREFLALHPLCAYCGEKAIHRDHVVPIALRRRHQIRADDQRYWVPACECNWRKGTRKYFPPGFDTALLPGKLSSWQEWRGGAHLEAKK